MAGNTGAALNGNKTDVEGHFKPLSQLFSPGVIMTTDTNAMRVSQRGAGANMSVDVAAGIAILQRPDGAYSYQSWFPAVENVVVTPSNPTNPRIDTIVAYVDTSIADTVGVNAPGSLKLMNIAGTPAGSPSPVNNSTIQAAVGGSAVAWIKLATVYVTAGVSSITSGNVTDARTGVLGYALPVDGTISSAKLGTGSVSNVKLSTTTGELGGVSTTWTPTWTNLTIGNATTYYRYTRFGKWIEGEGNVILGNTSSVAGSAVALTLPAAPAARYANMKFIPIGLAIYCDEGSDTFSGAIMLDRGTSVAYLVANTANATYSDYNNVLSSVPFTWSGANADSIGFSFRYEAA